VGVGGCSTVQMIVRLAVPSRRLEIVKSLPVIRHGGIEFVDRPALGSTRAIHAIGITRRAALFALEGRFLKLLPAFSRAGPRVLGSLFGVVMLAVS
jgi:hypothetical protein